MVARFTGKPQSRKGRYNVSRHSIGVSAQVSSSRIMTYLMPVIGEALRKVISYDGRESAYRTLASRVDGRVAPAPAHVPVNQAFFEPDDENDPHFPHQKHGRSRPPGQGTSPRKCEWK